MTQYLLFDWSGTLANEYKLDKRLCAIIEAEISEKLSITGKLAKQHYVELLTENQHSWEWYDYTLHARLFGFDWRQAHELALPKIKLIPKTKEVLSHYREKGFKIYLLTNAVHEIIDLRLDYLCMKQFFDLIITSDMVKAPKSSGKHLALALESIDDQSNCYAIGDDLLQDIVPAKQLGIKTIQCMYKKAAYAHTTDLCNSVTLCKPDYIVHKLTDLFSIIL